MICGAWVSSVYVHAGQMRAANISTMGGMKHRVLVTGASGFVGKGVVAELLRRGLAGQRHLDGIGEATGQECGARRLRGGGAVVEVYA